MESKELKLKKKIKLKYKSWFILSEPEYHQEWSYWWLMKPSCKMLIRWNENTDQCEEIMKINL